MKKKLVFLVPALLGLFLSACGGSSGSSAESTKTSEPTSVSESTKDPSKLDFTGVTFESAAYTYDGKPHILNEVNGVPENTTITYTGREEHTDAGTYNATAKLTKDGYNDKTLNATLTINKSTFTGYTYNSVSVKYDGKDHINDVQLIGTLPSGTKTEETITDANKNKVTSAIEVGTYNYQMVLTNKNFETVTLNATLTIKAQNKDMPVFVASDGTIYFANGLHNSYLYSLNSSSELHLIDYSSPKEFNKYNSSSALFIAGSTLLNAVKEVKAGSTSVLYTDGNIDDFVKLNDNIYYYSSNSLRSSKSGIYKVDVTDKNNEPVVKKVFEGKSDNLAIYGNNLYFTNGNDKDYVYKMDLSTSSTSLVLEEKVHEFTISGNRLYCTVNGLVNDYIGYVDLSSSSKEATKLTNAAGEFLTVKNGYLYYNYTDLFSYIAPENKGIWRINVSGGNPEQLVVTENVNGFDVESSSSLVYIDTTDLHLYRYNISTKKTTDLLNGFVAPESVPFNTGGQTVSLGNKTYYLNMYAGKTLYVYDEVTKKSSQLTANKVEDFYIYGDTLYFNQVTLLTNNDLYTADLKMGGEAEKINSNDVRNMISDGTYLYATHYNWAGVAGGISRMKLDGSEYVKFSDVNGAKNFAIRDKKLYYINCDTGATNGDMEYIDLSTITATSEEIKGTKLSNNLKNVSQFLFEGNKIYFSYEGTINNYIAVTDFTALGSNADKMASSKTHPRDMIIYGDYIYYYSYASTAVSSAGIYRVSKTATSDGSQELLLASDSTYYASCLSISSSGYLYFLNYIPKLLLGNAHFYQLNLSNKEVVKIN